MMEKLPSEIAFEIFYRLPPESVVACKFVCKSWRSLLLPCGDDGNCFANMHLRRRHHQRNLDYSTLNCITIHKCRDEKEDVVEFHITEYNDEVEGLNYKVKRLTFSQVCISGWLSMTRLIGSCNGLLCLIITYRRLRGTTSDSLKDRIVVVCNPLLHEYVTLPLSDLQYFKQYAKVITGFGHNHITDEYKVVITGFGHNHITDEYKVVRVYYRQHSFYIGEVEVYTLGKNSNGAGLWRSKGTIKHFLQSFSLFINGSIHWLANIADTGPGSEHNIVSFNLEDEEFRVIPLPTDLIINYYKSIGQLRELRGCLCLIGEVNWDIRPLDLTDRNLDIWVLKDYMNKESWVKEFSIKWGGEPPLYSPVAIKKKKDVDGDEILLRSNGERLVSYDPKTQSFEEVLVGGRQVVSISMYDPEPLLYINSLVSLKALGEDVKYAKNHPKTKA